MKNYIPNPSKDFSALPPKIHDVNPKTLQYQHMAKSLIIQKY